MKNFWAVVEILLAISITVSVNCEMSTRFKSAFANCTDPDICIHEFCYIKAYSRKLATLNFSLTLKKKLVKPYYASYLESTWTLAFPLLYFYFFEGTN